jgi:hypothetical protein
LALFRAIPSGDEVATAKTISGDSSTSLGMTRAGFLPNAERRVRVKRVTKYKGYNVSLAVFLAM